ARCSVSPAAALEAWLPGIDATLWSLAAVRLWALLRVQAGLAAAAGWVWEPCAAALAGLLACAVAWGPALPLSELAATDWLALALAEFALGSLIGVVVSLPGQALVGAADVSAALLGQRGPGGTRRLIVAIAVATGLSLGLHRPLVAALLAIFTPWPLGQPMLWIADGGVEWTWAIGQAMHAFTILALALATPALLTAAISELTLAAVGAGARGPAAIVEVLRPWIRTAAVVIALVASVTAYPHLWGATLGPR
ncbi:MAG: hypothetical protein KC636_23600, partial [Myxococcales bacterium]|nr:hypothetical protein [Myxococcales bacterium]